MAGKIVSMSEIESHLNAVQGMIDAARKMDSPTLNFGEIRKRAMALYEIVAPDDDASTGDNDLSESVIRRGIAHNPDRETSMPADAALVRRGAAAARRLEATQRAVGSSAVAAIFPSLGQPIERRTIDEDMRVAEIDQIHKRVMAGDSISEIWPQFRRELV